MPLNSKTINQFVKATSNEKKDKKEKFVYGKITSFKNDKYYVTLDGSNIETPISRFTSTVNVDSENPERVIVMIKNHEAIVTGNVSSAATTESYVNEKLGEFLIVNTLEVSALWNEYFESL